MTVPYLPDITTELCLSAGAFEFEADDSFNRADNAGSLGYADSRQPWIAVRGTPQIASNKAGFSALDAGSAWAKVRSLANGTVSATVSTYGTIAAVVFRAVDIDNFWRLRGSVGSTVALRKRVDGVDSLVGTWAGPAADGDVLEVVTEGGEISCYVNGVLRIGPVTDTDLMNEPYVGIYAESTAARIDNFSASFVWTDIGQIREIPSIQYGRQHELAQMETATADVVLPNEDRQFDPLFTSSPHYPFLLPYIRIRQTATWAGITYPLYYGHIERWPLDYNRMGTDGTVKVTAVDRLAVIGAGLWDAYPDTVIGMDPDAYWRMGAA